MADTRDPAGGIATAIQSGERLILVEAADESRAEELITSAAAKAGLRATVHDAAEDDDQAAGLFRRIDAGSDQVVVALDAAGLLREPAFARRLVRWARTQSATRVAFIVEQAQPPPALLPHACILELSPPTLAETDERVRRLMAAISWTPEGPRDQLERRSRRLIRLLHGLAVPALGRAVRRIVLQAPDLGGGAVRLARAARSEQVRPLPFVQVINDPPRARELGGLNQLKAWMESRRRAGEMESLGHLLPPIKGVLLVGVPGCGKSLASKVAASVLGFPLLRLELGALRAGDTAPEILLRRGLLEAERAAPCVLWLDEIDHALRGAHARAENHGLVGTLATWMQERSASVFVAATANDVKALPPELARKGRFDEIFFVDLPTAGEREEILRVHLLRVGVDPAKLHLGRAVEATRNHTGSEVAAAVSEAAIAAAVAGKAFDLSHLLDAASRIVPLVRTYDEELKALREWARTRARSATQDAGVLGLFEDGEDEAPKRHPRGGRRD